MHIIPQYLPPAHPFSIKCADSAPGSHPGASCAAAAERRDFRLWPLRIDAGAVTGRRVQCVCRCHRTSACTRSGKVRLGQDSSSYRMLNSRNGHGGSPLRQENAVSASAYRRSPSTDSFRLASILARRSSARTRMSSPLKSPGFTI